MAPLKLCSEHQIRQYRFGSVLKVSWNPCELLNPKTTKAFSDLLLSSQTLALLKRKKFPPSQDTLYPERERKTESLTGETGLCWYELPGVMCHSKNYSRCCHLEGIQGKTWCLNITDFICVIFIISVLTFFFIALLLNR